MRPAAALSLLLCAFSACSSLSSQERNQLSAFERQAKIYYDGNKLEQALDQCERGLALEADHYMLNTLKGAILLRASQETRTGDYRLLDDATAQLAKVFDWRRQTRHEPALLFHYALALQHQGRRHLLLSQQAAASSDDGAAAKARDERAEAVRQFESANSLFATLLDHGDLVRLCHYHQLLAARDLGDDAAFALHETKFLEQTAIDQAAADKIIKTTTEPVEESVKRVELAEMRRQELDMRSLFAEIHYQRGERDPEEYKKALKMLDRALELDPRRSSDYYNRGRVHLQLGHDELAKADFKKFLATTELPATSEKAIFAAMTISK